MNEILSFHGSLLTIIRLSWNKFEKTSGASHLRLFFFRFISVRFDIKPITCGSMSTIRLLERFSSVSFRMISSTKQEVGDASSACLTRAAST